jgi:alcohol dehydrogenase
MPASTAGVFSDVKPNPISANVNAGIEVLRAGGHDGVIALAAAPGSIRARSSPSWPARRARCGTLRTSATGGRAPTQGHFPIVAVPTTAGTGSEVGRAGVVTDETTHTKKVIFHPLMMPKVVIADPS